MKIEQVEVLLILKGKDCGAHGRGRKSTEKDAKRGLHSARGLLCKQQYVDAFVIKK